MASEDCSVLNSEKFSAIIFSHDRFCFIPPFLCPITSPSPSSFFLSLPFAAAIRLHLNFSLYFLGPLTFCPYFPYICLFGLILNFLFLSPNSLILSVAFSKLLLNLSIEFLTPIITFNFNFFTSRRMSNHMNSFPPKANSSGNFVDGH